MRCETIERNYHRNPKVNIPLNFTIEEIIKYTDVPDHIVIAFDKLLVEHQRELE